MANGLPMNLAFLGVIPETTASDVLVTSSVIIGHGTLG